MNELHHLFWSFLSSVVTQPSHIIKIYFLRNLRPCTWWDLFFAFRVLGVKQTHFNPMLSPIQYPLALWRDPVWQLSERLSVDHWTAQCTDGLHACWVQIISTLSGLLIQLLALDLRPGQMTYLLLLAPQQQTEHDISHDTRSLTYIMWWPHFHEAKLPLKRKETHRTEWNKEWRLCQSIHHLTESVCTYQSQHVIKLIPFISSIHVPGLIVHD